MRADHDLSSSTDHDVVTLRRSELDAILARLDALEAPAAPESADAPDAPDTPIGSGPVGRRRALLGFAAGAAAAGVATVARPAAAANGDPLIIGLVNGGTSSTRLTVTGATASAGLAVIDNSTTIAFQDAAVVGTARNTTLSTGMFAFGEDGARGLIAATRGGGTAFTVSGDGGQAASLFSSSPTLPAVQITMSRAEANATAVNIQGPTQLRLVPNSQPAPPGTSVAGSAGQMRWTGDGALWICVADGTPGTWRRVVAPNTAGSFHLLPTPARVYDSRPGTAPDQGPKTPLPAGNVARTIDLKANGSTVPADAVGVVLTVLLVNAAAGAGNFTVWANDEAKPLANSLVWGGDAGRFTTLAMSAVDAQARVKVDASLQTNVVLDVVGFYR